MYKTLLSAVFFVFAAASASAQTDFHAYLGSEDLIEGGRVEKITVVCGNYQFVVRPPKEWYRQMDDASRKIVFTAPTGKSAITLQFTTNSPNFLPPQDELRDWAMREHPSSSVIQTTICPTGYHPGLAIDLVRLPTPGVIQKIRQIFLAEPLGVAEIGLTASDDEFDKDKNILMATARAFRVEPLRAATP